MSPGLPSKFTHYQVSTPVYTGPLDLLLQLIERAELDITRLAIAQVTDQYLETIKRLPETAPEEISAFLVIAARLIQIKSEALLPRPPHREPGEEDPGDALARQLVVYKRFKQLAEVLATREFSGNKSFPRLAPAPRLETAFDMAGLKLSDLHEMAHWLLAQEKDLPELTTIVPMPLVTIREKIALIAGFLRDHPVGSFDALIQNREYRLDVVVTFLALLELIKRRMILATQVDLFGPIGFEPAEAWSEDISFDLEFGE